MGSDAGKCETDEEEHCTERGTRSAIGNVIGKCTSGTGDFNLDSARRIRFTTKRTEFRVCLTHGDHFVLTGPTKKLMEFERKMTSVYPIKAKIIRYGPLKSIKTLNRRLHWGKRGIVYQHDPRHVDVFVKDRGLEHGNSVQTPATPGVTEEEESEPLSQAQHHKYRSQVARFLFLSQDRADNIHRERVVPKDVESHSAEPCKAEKACQAFGNVRDSGDAD